MEVSALKYSGGIGLHGRPPLLRLQSDERLIAYLRRGNTAAFEVLVARYESRLLAFCRHLLGSREDAEDVLQEVMTAAFNAILADERPINVRPWLYRIARNRSLNHLRRTQRDRRRHDGHHLADHGASTADKVHEREEFRLLVGDIQELPETQKTALVLREMDALSYEQIAEAMETTVPSVKSLLVRARVSLAEAAEARLLSCDEVRIELGEVAEGLRRRPSPLVRRHLRDCERCSIFRSQLRHTNKALAALMPIGPLVVLKQLAFFHLSRSAATHTAAASHTAAAAGATGAGAAGRRGRRGGHRGRRHGAGRLGHRPPPAAFSPPASARWPARPLPGSPRPRSSPRARSRPTTARARATTITTRRSPRSPRWPPPSRRPSRRSPPNPSSARPSRTRPPPPRAAHARRREDQGRPDRDDRPADAEHLTPSATATTPVNTKTTPAGRTQTTTDPTVLTPPAATHQRPGHARRRRNPPPRRRPRRSPAPRRRSPPRPASTADDDHHRRPRPRRRPRAPTHDVVDDHRADDHDAHHLDARTRRSDLTLGRTRPRDPATVDQHRSPGLLTRPELMIDFADFQAVDMRVGRVLAVEEFPEARKPAWKLTIDFGPETGVKRSSAQITHYDREELVDTLVDRGGQFPAAPDRPVHVRGAGPRRAR